MNKIFKEIIDSSWNGANYTLSTQKVQRLLDILENERQRVISEVEKLLGELYELHTKEGKFKSIGQMDGFRARLMELKR